ncbi:phage tail assembly protein [Undibacterium sp. TC9W]|uniref:phage tail assembly protein n=1 Tax=Undibacterium sp. TC9W TaxID=3413053 RepID=UPI003BF14878
MTTANSNEVIIINSKTITLDEPIKRGDTTITSITLRKPKAGELRGVSLVELGQMNVAALQQVLPRITTPILTAQDVANLDVADLVEIGSEVSLFLVKKADRMAYQKE